MERYDVIIVGGGPAGLTAAVYAGRAGKSVAVFERETVGGQIAITGRVDNYPAAPGISGADFSMQLEKQAADFGAKLIFGEVTAIEPGAAGFAVRSSDGEYEASAVILATGLSHSRLGLKNEAALIGMGISFCAVCDGMFFRGKDVAVYGNGNTTLEDALYLSAVASRVTVIHTHEKYAGSKRLLAELEAKENVEFALNKTVVAVEGAPMLKEVTLRDNASGEESTLSVSGLFIGRIGQTPSGKIFADLVPTDEAGYYLSDENCATPVPGLFVAGDGRSKSLRQLTTAVADGAVAATSACRYVDGLSAGSI